MQAIDITGSTTTETVDMLARRVRKYLVRIAGSATPITYQALAKALGLAPPNTIHQITIALESLIEEDVVANRPLIATLVISKARHGLPAPGFFNCARHFGRLNGDLTDAKCSAFHSEEFNRAVEYWGKAGVE